MVGGGNQNGGAGNGGGGGAWWLSLPLVALVLVVTEFYWNSFGAGTCCSDKLVMVPVIVERIPGVFGSPQVVDCRCRRWYSWWCFLAPLVVPVVVPVVVQRKQWRWSIKVLLVVVLVLLSPAVLTWSGKSTWSSVSPVWYAGGNGTSNIAGAGGGASEAGATDGSTPGGHGGDGLSNSITGAAG